MSCQGNISLDTNGTIPSIFSVSFNPNDITVWLSAYASVCFACTLSNMLVIALIFSHRKLRTACGVLIAHSIITHTTMCAVNYPLAAVLIGLKQLNHWSINPQYCDLIMWIQMTCRYSSNFIETYIAVNRVVAVCWPYKYRSFANRKLEHAVIAGIWIGSALMACLPCFDLGMDYILVSSGSCTTMELGHLGKLYFILGFYLPFGLTGAGYILVNLKVMFARKRRIMEVSSASENGPHQHVKPGKRRLTTANMMFVTYIGNGMCYLLVVTVMFTAAWLYIAHPIVLLWLGLLQVLGYATEPVIFFVMNKDYRTEFSLTWKKLTATANGRRVAVDAIDLKTGISK